MLFWLSKLEIYFSMLYLFLVLKFLKTNYYQLKFQISL